jgi:DNA-binding LytR/AlgR family response regulator
MEDVNQDHDLAEELNCCLFAVSKTYLTMKDIEHHLPKPLFARIHRSFLINVNFVKVIERSQVRMKNGDALIMGDYYKKQFLDLMDEHLIKTDR